MQHQARHVDLHDTCLSLFAGSMDLKRDQICNEDLLLHHGHPKSLLLLRNDLYAQC